jgi:hypothetical protein
MMALLTDDQLILTANFVECAALWSHDEAVYLNVWDPCCLELYRSRWCRLPGDLRLAGHLDFRDAGGRTWVEVYDWSYPPHPQCTHPDVLAQWDAALARSLLTWESSLTHPRFAWVRNHNPLILR